MKLADQGRKGTGRPHGGNLSVQRYEPRAGIGTVVALMLPDSIAFYLAWVGLLVVWMGSGWPLGPGAPLFIPAP